MGVDFDLEAKAATVSPCMCFLVIQSVIVLMYSALPAVQRDIRASHLNTRPAQHFVGYDPEGYSIWFCDYKYPDENTVNYVVMNKVQLR